MTAREIVRAQIDHQETPVVPYTLPIGKEVRDELTEHFCTPHWEDRITYYIFDHGGMLSNMEVWTDDMHYRDPFGTLWRNDEEPAAVAEPALKDPNFDGYKFPTADELRAEIRKLKSEMSKGGGYILAPAKPLRPETPAENAVAILEEFIADESQ